MPTQISIPKPYKLSHEDKMGAGVQIEKMLQKLVIEPVEHEIGE